MDKFTRKSFENDLARNIELREKVQLGEWVSKKGTWRSEQMLKALDKREARLNAILDDTWSTDWKHREN